MKRKNIWQICFLTVFLVLQGAEGAASAKTAGEPLRCIAFYTSVKGVNSVIAQATQEIERQLAGNQEMNISAYQLSHEAYSSLDYKVDITIELGMDVLILSGAAATGETASFEKLKKAGVKLILIDGDVPESGRCAYVGTDNRRAGEQGAELLGKWSEHCKVGILSSPVKGSSSLTGSRQERRLGFLDAAEKRNREEKGESIQIAAEEICPLETEEAAVKVKQLLEKNRQINALFCLDSASAIAAAQAVRQLKKTEEIYVVCFDRPAQVEEEMERGGIDAALVQDSVACGRLCVGILEELSENRDSVCDRREMLECEIVTAE